MKKFRFQVIDKNGKTLAGSVSGNNEIEVRAKLQKRGFVVLVIQESKEGDGRDSGKVSFEFLAVNPEGKEIKGTIEKEDYYEAYKKLRSDYKFDVKYLVQSNLPESQKNILKTTGIKPSVIERYNEEVENSPKKKEEVDGAMTMEQAVHTREKEMQFLRLEISKII